MNLPQDVTKTLVLGPEHDDRKRRALRAVLQQLGAIGAARDWGVGGSQEIESVHIVIEGNPLNIEAETYCGLSITGDAALVDRVAALVQEQLHKR